MTAPTAHHLAGARGQVVLHRWSAEQPRFGVVLAHGYGEHARRYDHVADAFVAAGGEVVAPDHLGHGASEGDRASAESLEPMVDDLAAARDVLAGEHPDLPLVLLGHSMGAILAVRLAQRDLGAWQALVLTGPAIGGNPALEGALAMEPFPEIPIDPSVLSRDPAVAQAYMTDPLTYHGPFQKPMLEAMMAAGQAIAEGPGLGALPTLWLHGEADELVPIGPAREAVERIRGEATEEKSYPEARHEILNEVNREEVMGDVLAFATRFV